MKWDAGNDDWSKPVYKEQMEIRICVVINKRCPALPILFGRLPLKTDHLDCKIDHDNVVFCYCCFKKPEFKKIQASRKKTKAKRGKTQQKNVYLQCKSNKVNFRLLWNTKWKKAEFLRGGVTKGIILLYLFIKKKTNT